MILVERGVDRGNVAKKTLNILKSPNFSRLIDKVSLDDSIIIKPNIATVSQINYYYGTDPTIVNTIMEYLLSKGYKNVVIAEAQCNLSFGYICMTPDVQGRSIGYNYPIIDLTKTKTIPFRFGKSTVHLSRVMIDAKFIINVPKAKNHDLMLMTGCLKNMYGSIPDRNKWNLFHRKASGLSVEEVTYYVNVSTPVSYNIVDFVDSIDGQEVSLFRKPVSNFKYYHAGRLVHGVDSLAIDKYLSLKMGYDQDQSQILKLFSSRVGNFDVCNVRISGDDFFPLPGWKKISWFKNIVAKTQDNLPVGEGLLKSGMRMYYYDVCPVEEKKKDD